MSSELLSRWLIGGTLIAFLGAGYSPAAAKEPVQIAAATKPKAKPSTTKSATATKTKTASSPSKTTAKKDPPEPPKPTPTPVPLTTETLPQKLEQLLQSSGRQTKWGVMITHVESGQAMFSHGQSAHFIPASNRKIFTGALALDQLGPDYKFRTYLYRTGNVDANGTLQGNLVILPQGDPTFSNRMNRGASTTWIFDDWVAKAKAANIKTVTGDLLIDVSDWVWTDLMPRGWPTRVLQDNYAVNPGPLTLNENIIGVKVTPSKAGQPPTVSFFPPADGYPVNNTAVTGGKGRFRIVKPVTGPIQISGTGNQFTEVAIPCDNPTLFAVAAFRHKLNAAGITISGTARIITRKNIVPAPTSETVVALYESPGMADLVKKMMKESNNHFAEQLFVAVSAAKTRKGGYTESRRLENDLLRRAGIDVSRLQFGDGSGLSETNQVTPEQITKLLAYMMRHPSAGRAFVESMAIGGVDGTLRGRMHTNGLQGKVYAKTGFINRVSCLSGYFFKAPGQTFLFSFLANNIPGGPGTAKSTQDKLLDTVAHLQM